MDGEHLVGAVREGDVSLGKVDDGVDALWQRRRRQSVVPDQWGDVFAGGDALGDVAGGEDGVTAARQVGDEVAGDEAGGAGDEYVHDLV